MLAWKPLSSIIFCQKPAKFRYAYQLKKLIRLRGNHFQSPNLLGQLDGLRFIRILLFIICFYFFVRPSLTVLFLLQSSIKWGPNEKQ
jgi:hypothetical protein